MIFGVSSITQIEEVISWIKKGSLSDEVVGKIDEFWKIVENESRWALSILKARLYAHVSGSYIGMNRKY